MRHAALKKVLRFAFTVLVLGAALAAPAGLAAQQANEDGVTTQAPASASPGAPASDAPVQDPTQSAPTTSVQVAANPAAPSRASASASKSVSIVDFAFEPKTITVHTGDNVVWTNSGQADHTVRSKDLDSTVLKTNDSYTHTFNQAGTFSYICSIHPTSMKGTVKVLARSAGSKGSLGSKRGGGPSSGKGSSSTSAGPSSANPSNGSAASSSSGGGSGGSLPATGSDEVGLAILGLLLLDLGLAVRVVVTRRAARL